jgi:hydroxymethylpyrimidine/phosphomethylpyrimidine kinase
MIRTLRQRETSPAHVGAPPVVLTIAGSDNSGGAGIQADLKTFTTLGAYGTSAITCVVAEHPGRVLNITPLPPRRVADQIRLVLEAFPVTAIKTGMLFSAEIIDAIEEALEPAFAAGIPLVIDPVMAASTGRGLMKPQAMRALRRLIARADLVTPNRKEAALLWHRPIKDEAVLEKAAVALAQVFGRPHVLAKGGHFETSQSIDVLASPEGKLRRFRAKRIPGLDPHGTGCTYSAAIAVGLARKLPMAQAVGLGKRFINRALRRRFALGSYQLLNHLPDDQEI